MKNKISFEEIKVCVDCIQYIANGESENADKLEKKIQAYIGVPSGALLFDGYEYGFETSTCKACGSNLHGDRFKAYIKVENKSLTI